MAVVTNLLWLNPDSIPENIATGDTVTAPGDWTFEGNVDILGSLTVTGSITSGSTLNSVSHDAFFDLGFGYLLNTANQPGGLTLDTRLASGFVPGEVTNFPTLTTFTYTDTGGCTLLAPGDVVMITNLSPATLSNEGYYIVQSVSGAAFPQTVTIYSVSQASTPWANTTFLATGAVVPPGNAAKVNLSIIAVADGTSQFTDADGNPWPVGTVLSAYVTNATLAQFQAPGAYNSIGNTSLQRAYDNGNTISTDGGVPIAFTVSDGDFTVDGTGLVDIDVGTSVGIQAPTLDVGTTAVARNVNVGTGAAAQLVTIGSFTSTSSSTVQGGTGGITVSTDAVAGNISVTNTSTGVLNLFNDTGTGAVNIVGSAATGVRSVNIATGGTGAKTVSIGSSASTSSMTLSTGTGLMAVNAGDGIDINAVTAITVDSSGGTIGIGTDAVSQAINIGTAGVRAITVGNSTGASSMSLQVGTGALNIGTAATSKTIQIGTTVNTSLLNLVGGTGGIQMTVGATTGAITLTGSSSGIINIGNDTGTGTVFIGSSTGSRQIDIGNGATSTGNVNIVGSTATGARTVDVATGGTGTKVLRLGNDTVAASTTTIFGGTTGGINIGTTAVATPVNIATNTTAGTVSVGTGIATQTLNFGTGAGIKTTTVGSTNTTSTTTINGGTGGINIGNDAAGTGVINIAGAGATGARTVNIATGATGIKTVNIGTGSVDGNVLNIGTASADIWLRTITIGSGSLNSLVTIKGGSTGSIDIGTSNGTTLNLGTGAVAQTINIGTGAAIKTVNIATGAASQVVQLGSTTTSTVYVPMQTTFTMQADNGGNTPYGGGTQTVAIPAVIGSPVTLTQPNATITSPSWPATYPANADGYVVIPALGANTFYTLSGSYVTESNFDFIRIYSGVGIGGTLLATYSGTGTLSFVTPTNTTVSVRFNSDFALQLAGFSLTLTSYTGAAIGTGTILVNKAGAVVGPSGFPVPYVTPASANAVDVSERGFAGIATGTWTISGGRMIALPGQIVPVTFVAAPGANDRGKPVYLSTTAGQATMTAPSGSGQRVFQIGFLSSATVTGGNYLVQLFPQLVADIP